MARLDDLEASRQGWIDNPGASEGCRAMDANGVSIVDATEPTAVSWCLAGAIDASEGAFYGNAWHWVAGYLRHRGYSGYIQFNDAPGRTKEQVIGMLDDAIRHAKDTAALV